MTVAELIRRLGAFPADAVVAIYDHDEATHFEIESVTQPDLTKIIWGSLTAREPAPEEGVVVIL